MTKKLTPEDWQEFQQRESSWRGAYLQQLRVPIPTAEDVPRSGEHINAEQFHDLMQLVIQRPSDIPNAPSAAVVDRPEIMQEQAERRQLIWRLVRERVAELKKLHGAPPSKTLPRTIKSISPHWHW